VHSNGKSFDTTAAELQQTADSSYSRQQLLAATADSIY